jgi:hypothetical protein
MPMSPLPNLAGGRPLPAAIAGLLQEAEPGVAGLERLGRFVGHLGGRAAVVDLFENLLGTHAISTSCFGGGFSQTAVAAAVQITFRESG